MNMPKLSAGLLMYRWRGAEPELLIVHPGGPFRAKKDEGAWSIPKGEYAEGDDPLAAARREFIEETGFFAGGAATCLGDLKQSGGKIVTAWAVQGDCDASLARSNMFTMEWPPKSGRMQDFPEIDRAAWHTPEVATAKLLKGQTEFVDRLIAKLELLNATVSS